MRKQKVARLASLPMDYQRLGLNKDVALWEDGHRTSGKFGEYEWWYFDGKSNPVQLLVVKKAGLAPSYIRMIGTVTLDRFEGEEFSEHLEAPGLWEQMYFGLNQDV